MVFEIEKTDVVENNQCPCCLSESTTLISKCSTALGINFLSTTICNQCGHVFRSKVPTEDWFNNAFQLRHQE